MPSKRTCSISFNLLLDAREISFNLLLDAREINFNLDLDINPSVLQRGRTTPSPA